MALSNTQKIFLAFLPVLVGGCSLFPAAKNRLPPGQSGLGQASGSKAAALSADLPPSSDLGKNIDMTATKTPARLVYDVPFTPQAPFGDWADVRQDYGCEEASLLMAMKWVRGETLEATEARDEIVAMSDYQLKNYGHHHDTSVSDTHKLLKDYFGYERGYVALDIGIEDIKSELSRGNLAIIPINGNIAKNIYYTLPGPVQHQVLVVGYDDERQALIAHDPGTSRGAYYEYGYDVLAEAIMDYESGLNEPLSEKSTAMLVIMPLDQDQEADPR